MENDIGPAAANAVAAGRSFWGNLSGMLESNTAKKRLAQEGDLAQKRLNLDVDEQAIRKRLVDQQIAQADLANRQAAKQDFLSSHNPMDSAKQAFGQRAGQAFLGQVKPVTDADVQAQNEAQVGPELAKQLFPNAKAVPGTVQFPMPSADQRSTFGIPADVTQDNWSMPKDKFDEVSGQFVQHLATQANAEFEKPFDQMSKEAQEAIIEAYQKNAPPGVKISDAEAAQAYRAQERGKAAPPNPANYGLMATSGEFDLINPASLKLNLTAPTTSAEGNEPYIRVGSELKPNPDFVPKKEVVERQEEVRSLGGIYQSIVDAEKALQEHGVVGLGPTGGGLTGQAAASVGQLLGSPDRKIAQRQMEMLINKSVLESVKLMKGNLSDRDVKFLQSTLPKLSDPPHVWNEFLSRWKGLVETSIGQKTGLIPAPSLPAVKVAPNVSGVGQRGRGPGAGSNQGSASGSSAPVSEGTRKFSSMEQAEAANLPPGTKVLIFDPASNRYRPATN